MNRHIPQATIDEARDAIRGGRRLEDIAGQQRTTPDQLVRLIGLPRLQPIPDESEPCIFEAAERLSAVL